LLQKGDEERKRGEGGEGKCVVCGLVVLLLRLQFLPFSLPPSLPPSLAFLLSLLSYMHANILTTITIALMDVGSRVCIHPPYSSFKNKGVFTSHQKSLSLSIGLALT
jgi:hypothetical protein